VTSGTRPSPWGRRPSIGLVAIVVLFTACSNVIEHPVKVVSSFPARPLFDLAVELRTEALRDARWETKLAGTTTTIPFADHLARNVEGVARGLFTRVIVAGTPGTGAAGAVDAVLSPRMAFVEQRMGFWGWEDAVMTMGLEWTLRSAEGTIIWVDTVKGTGKTSTGGAFTARGLMAERAGLVVEDVTRRSYDAIGSARAVREFAERRRRSGTTCPVATARMGDCVAAR
jgi:hypothetical protein